MLVKLSAFSKLICRSIDTKLKLKCVGRTRTGGYIISNNQLKLVNLPEPSVMPPAPVDVKGKRWKNHSAVRITFIEE